MLTDVLSFVGRTAHGMAKAAALAQQQLEYIQLLHCRSAGILLIKVLFGVTTDYFQICLP